MWQPKRLPVRIWLPLWADNLVTVTITQGAQMHNGIFPQVTDSHGWRPGREPSDPEGNKIQQTGWSGKPQDLLHRHSLTVLWWRGGQAAATRAQAEGTWLDRPRSRKLWGSSQRQPVHGARRKRPTSTYLSTSKYILKTNRGFYWTEEKH